MNAASAAGEASAATEHCKRMSELKDRVDAAAGAGVEQGDAASVAATAFYAAEAVQLQQSVKEQ